MPRFDLYRNPNARATHGLYLDVQSDLVRTATRWCAPLRAAASAMPVMERAQTLLTVAGASWLLDAPNILAVPAPLLRSPVARLESDEQLLVENTLDFVLRGY